LEEIMWRGCLFTLLWLSILAPAAATANPGIEVERAWARATPASTRTGVVYLTVANAGASADRLTEVSTPVAARADMYLSAVEGNVIQMRDVDAVDVKPGDRVSFKPGGLHIMLVNLKRPLQKGERFPLTLVFEKAGRIDVEVLVLSIGANAYP
jgi:periplasmic copper chaperone A